MTKEFDVAILSCSPLGLFEAAHQSSLGYKVLAFNKEPTIGGMWKTISNSYYEAMDKAQHLMVPHKNIRPFFEENINIELENISEKAFSVTPIPILERTIHKYPTWWVLEKGLLSRHIAELLLSLSQDKGINYDWMNKNYEIPKDKETKLYYFKQGIFGLHQKLAELIEKYDICIKDNTCITEVESRESCVILRTETEEFSVKKVIFSTYTEVPSLKGSKIQFDVQENLEVKNCMALTLAADIMPEFRLITFPGHPYLSFVSNITSHTKFKENKKHEANIILQLSFAGDAVVNQSAAGGAVAELVASGFLDRSAKVVSSELMEFRRTRIRDDFANYLKTYSKNRISVLDTTSFGRIVHNNFDRWGVTINLKQDNNSSQHKNEPVKPEKLLVLYFSAKNKGFFRICKEIIGAINIKQDLTILSLFAIARLYYEEDDYKSALVALTIATSKFPNRDMILNAAPCFTYNVVFEKRFFDFLRFSLTSELFSLNCYSILVSVLYNSGRIGEANSIHEFYVDNDACPNQMLFISQSWEYGEIRKADDYRKVNQESMKKLHEMCLELSSPYFSDAMAAYDFGCGSGLFGETLKLHVSKLVGIDFSPTFAESIRSNIYDEVVIIDGLEMEKLNLPKVDLVVAGAVIQYFGLIPPILTRLIDLIKVGGLIIFDTISKLDEGKCPSSLASVQAYSHNKNYVIETAQKLGLKSEKVSNNNFFGYQSDIFVFRKK